jgi:hypothetical protein
MVVKVGNSYYSSLAIDWNILNVVSYFGSDYFLDTCCCGTWSIKSTSCCSSFIAYFSFFTFFHPLFVCQPISVQTILTILYSFASNHLLKHTHSFHMWICFSSNLYSIWFMKTWRGLHWTSFGWQSKSSQTCQTYNNMLLMMVYFQ